MNKTITFVSLFRNADNRWHASFTVNGVNVGACQVPTVDAALFAKVVSAKGVKYLRSIRPLIVEFSDIREGREPGRYFTNIASITEQPKADTSEIDALLDA